MAKSRKSVSTKTTRTKKQAVVTQPQVVEQAPVVECVPAIEPSLYMSLVSSEVTMNSVSVIDVSSDSPAIVSTVSISDTIGCSQVVAWHPLSINSALITHHPGGDSVEETVGHRFDNYGGRYSRTKVADIRIIPDIWHLGNRMPRSMPIPHSRAGEFMVYIRWSQYYALRFHKVFVGVPATLEFIDKVIKKGRIDISYWEKHRISDRSLFPTFEHFERQFPAC